MTKRTSGVATNVLIVESIRMKPEICCGWDGQRTTAMGHSLSFEDEHNSYSEIIKTKAQTENGWRERVLCADKLV